MSFTVRNQGSGSSNSCTTNIRFNTSSSSVSTSDTLLKSVSTPGISADGTYNFSEGVTIPSGSSSGTYYIWVIADVNSAANQRDESNDKASTTFTVTTPIPTPMASSIPTPTPVPTPAPSPVVVAQSDLVVQNLTVSPSSGTAGSSATVSFTVYNQGNGTANASTARIRINTSSSSVLTSDTLLATVSVPGISSGGSYSVSQSVTIPSDQSYGTNYIWVILDVDSTANQSNETNDKASTTFTVTTPTYKSDLVAQNLAVSPSSGTAGSSATVSFTVYNQGNGAANASTARIRINTSSSSVLTSDTLLTTVSVPGISSGGSYSVSQSVTIPSDQSYGTNYIWVILDVDSTAGQSDETNDKASTTFTVTTPAPTPTPTASGISTPTPVPTPSPVVVSPCSVTDLTATAECDGTTSQIRLNWSAACNATSYDVYRNSSLYYSDVTGTQFINSGNITSGTTYSYYVQAKNSYGFTNSNTVSATAKTCSVTGTAPGSITDLTATAECDGTTSQIRLNWSAASNATSYDVYRNSSLYYSGVTGTQFINSSNITSGTTYSYYVQAKNSYGSTNSNTVSKTAITCGSAPGSITDLVATAECDGTTSQIRLNWSAASNATSYDVYRNSSLYYSGVSGTQFINSSNITSGTTYSYYIQAKNSYGSTNSNTVSKTAITCGSAPGSITDLAATVECDGTTSQIRLNWSAASNATSYDVYRNSSLYYSGVSGTQFINSSNITSGTTYSYYVQAKNSYGSTNSNTVSATAKTCSVSTQTERVTNGSFSSGTSGWTLSGDFWAGTTYSSYRTSPGYAAGGVDSGGTAKNNANGSMYQSVTIPSSATSATVSFWYNVTSNETGSGSYDTLNVTVQNSSGSYLATVAVLGNNDKGSLGVYSKKTLDVTSYKGQTIRIYFLATTDSNNTTTFRIDDVSLMSDGN